jgi:general secretion pathway protein I
MTITHTRPAGRAGLSLLEVLVALSIFLFALIGIGRLITLSAERAQDVQQQSQAARLCQSKLAEVVRGAVPLSSQDAVAFDEDPDWQWSLEAEQEGSIQGLWKVQVKVGRDRPDGTRIETTMSQWVLDPSMRGSSLDAQALAQSASSGSDQSGQPGAQSGQGSSPSQPSAAAASPSKPQTGAAAASPSKPQTGAAAASPSKPSPTPQPKTPTPQPKTPTPQPKTLTPTPKSR